MSFSSLLGSQLRRRGRGAPQLWSWAIPPARAEEWLKYQGARTLQVKTLAESHPSPEYAQTRKFYESVGYIPIEVFPTLWGIGLPVLQLVKVLNAG